MKQYLNHRKRFIIHFEFTVRQLISFVVLLALILYVLWELNWYSKIGLSFIKWHTHLAFVFLISVIISAPFFIWSYYSRSETSKKYLTIALSLALMIMLSEVIYSVLGTYKVYSEIRFGHYQTPYFYDSLNYYHIMQPHDSAYLSTPEFSYFRKYNSLGYSAPEWSKQKPDSAVRIITMGDSFTEGDGAPADSCYPVLMEKMLNAQGSKNYEVLNAGLCGSDPVNSFINLRD